MHTLDKRWILAVDLVLIAAIVIDVVLCGMTWIKPEMWFETLHGSTDNQSLYPFLRRCGAHWAAFAVFQLAALFLWRKRLHWLVLIAGMRFSDLFTDGTYLAASPVVTTSGSVSLLLPFWLNLGMAVILMIAFHKALGSEQVATLRLEPASSS